jgi:hypothetical protein
MAIVAKVKELINKRYRSNDEPIDYDNWLRSAIPEI